MKLDAGFFAGVVAEYAGDAEKRPGRLERVLRECGDLAVAERLAEEAGLGELGEELRGAHPMLLVRRP